MKKNIFHFLFVVLFPALTIAQSNTGTLSFFVRSSENGYGIKSSLQVKGEGQTFSLQTDEGGHFVFTGREGKYDVSVEADAFLPLQTHFVIATGKTVDVEVLLDAQIQKPADDFSYTYAMMEGYVVDYSSGKPMRGVKVFMDEKKVGATDEKGFFSVTSAEYSNMQSPDDKAVRKTFRFSLPDYSSFVLEDVFLFSTKATMKITLKKGKGTETQKYFQRTLDGTANDDQLYKENNPPEEGKREAASSAGCAVPSSIRVGTGCSCVNCSGVTVMSLQYYSESGLDDEWIAGWMAASLQAGSLPYRSYAGWYVNNPVNANFDIASTTCNQVWGSTVYASTQNAAQVTANSILTANGINPVRSEYSAENNKGGTSLNCVNCSAGGSGAYACYSDNICCGYSPAGHGRGMCQWGSQRWAQNSQTYSWIVNHYYISTVGYSICSPVSVPPPPVLSSTVVCGNKTLTRGTPPSGVTYYWQGTACGTSTANSALSYVVPSSGNYYLRARNSSGSWSSACSSLSVTINQIPANPSLPTVSTNSCGPKILTRSTPPSGTTYFWQTLCGTNTASSSATYSAVTSGTYRLRARTTAGCWSPTCAAVAVTVNPIPSPVISGQNAVCSNATGVIYSSPNTANVFLWTINGGTISSGQNTNSVSVNWGTFAGALLTLKETNPSTNCSKTVTLNISINSSLNPTIFASGPQTFCAGGSVMLDASFGFSSYLWNTGATTQTISVTNSGVYNVSVTASNACSGSSANSATVTVNPLPPIPVITQSNGIVTSSSSFGNQWFLDSVIISGATLPSDTITQNGYYTVVVTDSATGCSSTSAPFYFGAVGIKETEENNLNSTVKIYPNPSYGSFIVEFSKPVSNIKINLINVLGQSVNFTEIKKSETEMMIEDVLPGAYIIEILTDIKNRYYKKIIVN
ncbi:MAG: T9SS type A sorting domain-containing protein [Bacteroidetes bacterium]|nr:T9SS type A sorting domain-containing protein [Bacteroidota bacterium]